MKNLAHLVSNLDSRGRELLAELLRKEGVPASRIPILPRSRDGRPVPLSFTQERMWFLDQLEPGNPFYNNNFAFRLEGRLEVPVLERALCEVARRHEILRTTYPAVEGQARVVIHLEPELTLPTVDLSALPARRQNSEFRR